MPRSIARSLMLSCTGLMAIGPISPFSIAWATAPDTTPPVLHSIVVSGAPNMAGSDPYVTVSINATDDVSGVRKGVIYLSSPSAPQFAAEFTIGDSPLHLVRDQQIGVGRAGQGTGFYRFSQPGIWHVARVHLEDLAGNVRVVEGAELDSLGNTAFTVTNNKYDGIQPTLLKGRILTPEVSLSADYPYLKTSVTLKETGSGAPSGVDYVVLYYCLPPRVGDLCQDYLTTTGYFGEPAKGRATIITGGPVESSQPRALAKPRLQPPQLGTYELSHVILVTLDGNNAGYYSPLAGGGADLHEWFPSLTVTVKP